ncbi:MAG: ArsR/SmtB family transcription factor [bacterium]
MTEIINVAKALSDENRYNIIRLLLQRNYCVGALSKRLEISESAVSQHLKLLRSAGIVNGEKRGYFTHYSINRDILKETAKQIIELSQSESINSGCDKNTSEHHNCCKTNMNNDKNTN